MRRLFAKLLCLTVGSLAGGCTVLTSETASELNLAGRAPNGVHYALPKGVVDVVLSVSEADGLFELFVSQPRFVPDPTHRYFLKYRPHPSYDDEVVVTMVEDGRPFLKSINSTTTDKTAEILVNLAKAVAGGGGYQTVPEGKRLLGQVTIDPADRGEVAAAQSALDSKMRRYLAMRIEDCRANPPAEPAPANVCRTFETLAKPGRPHALLSLNVARAPQAHFGKRADCGVGICYRPKEPMMIHVSVGGVTDTTIVEVPNDAHPISIDIRRAFLVQKIQSLGFDDHGFLTEVKIDKKSELLAAASLPLQIASAVAEGLQLRIAISQQNTQNAKTEADLIRERAALQKSQQGFQSAAGAAAKGSTVRSYAPKAVIAGSTAATATGQGAQGQGGQGQGGSGQPGTGGGRPPVDPDLANDLAGRGNR